MNLKTLSIAGAALFALASVGCGKTVRVLTASSWVTLGGGAGAKGSTPEGQPAAAAPTPAEAAPAAAGGERVLYVTYWEGECSSGIGGRSCTKGNSMVKRCTVKPDNSMACVEEKDANRVFKTED